MEGLHCPYSGMLLCCTSQKAIIERLKFDGFKGSHKGPKPAFNDITFAIKAIFIFKVLHEDKSFITKP